MTGQENGKKKEKNVKNVRSPQLSVDDKMIREFHKALVAVSDSPFEQQFLNHRLLKFPWSPSHGAVSTGTNTQDSDF